MQTYKKYQPKPSRLTYEELESVVQGYRQGEDDCNLKLIDGFAGYMGRFKALIRQGNADISDKELRSFVGLFMPKERSAYLHQFRRNKNAVYDMYKTMNLIRDLFMQYADDEIENELYIALYTLARRYKSHGNYFHTYVQRAYRFQLYRQLKALLDSQLVTSNNGLPYDDEMYQYEDGDFSNKIIEERHLLIRNEPTDDINDNWINGLTTGDAFSELTRTQRRMLKLYYVDGLKDDEVADYMGVCRATANRRRLKTIAAIEEQLRKTNVIE